jgi:hypothetical protein
LAYSVSQVLLREYSSQLQRTGLGGFPASFRFFLFSGWFCLGTDGNYRVGQCSNLINMGYFNLNQTRVHVRLLPGYSLPVMFEGDFAFAAGGHVTHLLISLDGSGGIVQVYANDVPLALTGGGWVASPANFNLSGTSQWDVEASGSSAPGVGFGDLFLAAPASFFDLSVTANRRKFINHNLTPVDLGPTGAGPLGVSPPIFLTVRPGGVPDDFIANNGTGGAFENLGSTLGFLPDGACLALVPPPDVIAAQLALDDVQVRTIATPGCQVFLEWSDDRGHTFGNPVGQRMGNRGEYLASLQWQRLGYARDRVFRISWSCPAKTALQGAWIEADTSAKT